MSQAKIYGIIMIICEQVYQKSTPLIKLDKIIQLFLLSIIETVQTQEASQEKG